MAESCALPLQCSTCGKRYARSSHLRRHEATHTNFKGTACPACSKTFSRRDVARRHVQSCTHFKNNPLGSLTLPQSKRGRKPRVCDACSKTKLACDRELPCSRCRGRDIKCSYTRVEVIQTSPEQDTAYSSASETSFLLRMTNPRAHAVSDAISKDMEACDSGPESLISVPIPDDNHHTRPMEDDTDVWDFGGWVNWGFELPSDSDFTFEIHQAHLPVSDDTTGSLMSDRMDALVTSLKKTHQILALSNPDGTPMASFDDSLARKVFSVPNLDYFLVVFFQRVLPYHPIIHAPTFGREQVSLPLLLATFLLGAVFSPSIDDAVSARSFFDIAEDFIFNHPDMKEILFRVDDKGPQQTRHVEILQAALTILIIQNSRNDKIVRRRIRIDRSPRLNAAVRLSGALEAKHDRSISQYSATDWKIFIEQETKIRVAHWTQITNNFNTSCFNSHPHTYISEMTGDMPCRGEIFDAETPESFQKLVSKEPAMQSISLAEAVHGLMRPTFSSESASTLGRMSPEGLFILISALETTISVMRNHFMTSASSDTILRALGRWKGLWDKATTKTCYSPRPGFSKIAVEMWALCSKIVKVARTADRRSIYMTRYDLDSFSGLHEFLDMYRDV